MGCGSSAGSTSGTAAPQAAAKSTAAHHPATGDGGAQAKGAAAQPDSAAQPAKAPDSKYAAPPAAAEDGGADGTAAKQESAPPMDMPQTADVLSQSVLHQDLPEGPGLAGTHRRSLSCSQRSGGPHRRRRSLRQQEHQKRLGHFLEKGGKQGWDDEEGTPEEKLGRLFYLLDEDGGGTIDLKELQEGLERLGFQHSKEAVTQMFQLADVDGGGDIDRDEFAKFFKGLIGASGHHMGDDDYEEAESPRRAPHAEPLQVKSKREYEPGTRPLKTYSVKTFVGHRARVKCVAAGPSAAFFCSCDREDAVMHLHDLDSGDELRSFVAHQDTVMAVSLSPNQKHVATASRDGLLIVWDLTCGSVVKELEHPGVVTCCAFSPEGKCVVSGCQDNLARRWNIAKGRLAATSDNPTQEKGIVVAIAYSPGSMQGQETVALTRSRETSVRILDAATLQCRCTLGGHAAMLWSVCFSADGIRLLSSCERFVKVWDAPSLPDVITMDAAERAAVILRSERQSFCVESAPSLCGVDRQRPRIWTTACFCPGDFPHLLVAVSSDNAVHVLHAILGTVVLTIPTRAPVYCIGVAAERNDLCCGDEHGNVYRITLV